MVGVTTLPSGRPFTRADLDAVPDDGHRYELVDGALVVTPAPGPRHQDVVLELAVRLRERCPASLKVFVAPLDVVLDDNTLLQPDVLVARRSDVSARGLTMPPLLAVEVLSPSTRLVDLNLKRARYEAAACPAYWVVDPERPSLTAWELNDGRYVEVAHAEGTQPYAATAPFDVVVSPAALRND